MYDLRTKVQLSELIHAINIKKEFEIISRLNIGSQLNQIGFCTNLISMWAVRNFKFVPSYINLLRLYSCDGCKSCKFHTFWRIKVDCDDSGSVSLL